MRGKDRRGAAGLSRVAVTSTSRVDVSSLCSLCPRFGRFTPSLGGAKARRPAPPGSPAQMSSRRSSDFLLAVLRDERLCCAVKHDSTLEGTGFPTQVIRWSKQLCLSAPTLPLFRLYKPGSSQSARHRTLQLLRHLYPSLRISLPLTLPVCHHGPYDNLISRCR